MKNNYIIFGGTSLISYELIKKLEKKKNSDNHYLVFCRNKKKFFNFFNNKMKETNSSKISIFETDINNIKKVFDFLIQIKQKFNINGLFFLVGDSSNLENNFINEFETQLIFETNLINPVKIINFITEHMMNTGFVAVITSMAGIRGRKLRMHYCSAKAGLISYLSGLRQKLFDKGIKVIDLRAGYIKTEKFNIKSFNLLISSPQEVAELICDAIKKNKKTVYTKFIWSLVSIILQLIPESIFQKLKF